MKGIATEWKEGGRAEQGKTAEEGKKAGKGREGQDTWQESGVPG